MSILCVCMGDTRELTSFAVAQPRADIIGNEDGWYCVFYSKSFGRHSGTNTEIQFILIFFCNSWYIIQTHLINISNAIYINIDKIDTKTSAFEVCAHLRVWYSNHDPTSVLPLDDAQQTTLSIRTHVRCYLNCVLYGGHLHKYGIRLSAFQDTLCITWTNLGNF